MSRQQWPNLFSPNAHLAHQICEVQPLYPRRPMLGKVPFTRNLRSTVLQIFHPAWSIIIAGREHIDTTRNANDAPRFIRTVQPARQCLMSALPPDPDSMRTLRHARVFRGPGAQRMESQYRPHTGFRSIAGLYNWNQSQGSTEECDRSSTIIAPLLTGKTLAKTECMPFDECLQLRPAQGNGRCRTRTCDPLGVNEVL